MFLKDGRTFQPIDKTSVDLYDRLPAGTYTIKASPMGFLIEQIDNMELPPKIYGNTEGRAERILKTFNSRSGSTGVLLSGQKGSGKTMLAKRISQIAMGEDVITIVINQPLRGESFNSFVQNIHQPAIILFDEFEKVYGTDEQEELLTLFDGTYQTKKLFILTCNDRWRVGQYMHNRPGRLFYAIEYGGLDEAFIREYCEDTLVNKAHIKGVQTVAAHFTDFSFDMLKALVEEMNRYGETAGEAMDLLNIKPQSEDGGSFEVNALINGQSAKELGYGIGPDVLTQNPMTVEEFYVGLFDKNKRQKRRLNRLEGAIGGVAKAEVEQDDDELESMTFELSHENLEVIRPEQGIFVFATPRPDVKIVLTRKRVEPRIFRYDAY